MLIVVDEGFVINLKDFEKMTLFRNTKKVSKKTSDGLFGLFPKFKDEEEVSWDLMIHYTDLYNEKKVYGMNCPDRSALVKSAQRVLEQIKRFDPSMINEAFEEAFLKDDK